MAPSGEYKANLTVHVNPHTNSMEYSTLAYILDDEPATNFSCKYWVRTITIELTYHKAESQL